MSELFIRIRDAVAEDRYVIGRHAAERLNERRIVEWQVALGTSEARLVRERPDAKPNPAVDVQVTLPDGTVVIAVWSWLPLNRMAKLVTVHYLDR